jgi:diguanylate cyclase (GGDEF)-like protein
MTPLTICYTQAMEIAAFIEKRSKVFWVSTGTVLVLILGIIDFQTGFEISISFFYLIPIFLVVWFTNVRVGLILSAISALTWFIADYSAGLSYSHPTIYVWNTLLRLGFYFVVTWLVSTLKKSFTLNRELARIDYVTGAVSIRYFYDLAQIEMRRAQRYRRAFTLAYLDLDEFKAINDRLGHSTGDKVLRSVTKHILGQVRSTDTLARLGGDEFTLLLPETGPDAARTVINRLHSGLINEMSKNGWMVTFSIGVVTFIEVPETVDDMVKTADAAMYSVKNGDKNGVYYCIYTG